MILFTDTTFEKKDFREAPLEKGEYENCKYAKCILSGTDLSTILFIDCTFSDCDLSLVNLAKTCFRDVAFKDCKMWGLHFENADPFGLSVTFDHCSLNHSSFYQVKLKKVHFKGCTLHEADFTESDLTSAIFNHCDLARATFDHTILEKADFRTAVNYSIDPEKNKIKKARFSTAGITGLLDKYDIDIS
jgi:uncharacterized protein YjbI with pentapeptide repeats